MRYEYAADYLDYLGTDSLTAQQVKQAFYKLACNFNIQVSDRVISVTLNGLSENMAEALALLENLIQNAKVDQAAYDQYVSLLDKARADAKLDQKSCFYTLFGYGVYGPYNSHRNLLTTDQLRQTSPQDLLDLLKNLSQYEHTLLYYGPMSEQELSDVVGKRHVVPETLKAVPENKKYVCQPTPQNEILIAPYDAKNIYMRMYHNSQRPWKADEEAVLSLFNEYFGGGMNTVVFQEMRETRGLAYNAWAIYRRPSIKDDTEDFFTHIITQNDKMMDCVNHFLTILDTIPQSEASFKVAKEGLTKQLASRRTTKFGLINAWLDARDLGIDYDLNKTVYEALPGLTMQDIVDFAQQQIAHKPYRYIILGNERDLDMAALQKIGPVRRATINEIFGY